MAAPLVANWLMGAMVAQGAYGAKRSGDRAEQARDDAKEARTEVKAAEKAKAQLLKQGVQEQAVKVQDKDPNASTGGVEMSTFAQLGVNRNKGTGANV